MRSYREQLLDPAFVGTLDTLELQVSCAVEGFLHGRHRSAYLGCSVEFMSHRQYQPGDDLRYLNWKVLARQDRLYIKEFAADSNLTCHLVLDTSRSMGCANGPMSKFRYGCIVAGAFTLVALRQQDAAGLTLFADRVHGQVPARVAPTQLDDILLALDTVTDEGRSDHRRALHQVAEAYRRRGLIVLISDLIGDIDGLLEGLDHLRFGGHEVLVVQVLDPYERDLDVDGPCRFVDRESGAEVRTTPAAIREDYQRAVTRWLDRLGSAFLDRGIDWLSVTTADPFDVALTGFIARRFRPG